MSKDKRKGFRSVGLNFQIEKGETLFTPEEMKQYVKEYLEYTDEHLNDDMPHMPTRSSFVIWLRNKHDIWLTRMTLNNWERNEKYGEEFKWLWTMIDDFQVSLVEQRATGGMFGSQSLQMLFLKNKGGYVDRVENINVEGSTFEINDGLDKELKDLEMK